jgi:uncharacterized protein
VDSVGAMERTQQFLENYETIRGEQLNAASEEGRRLTGLAIDGGGVRGLVPALLLEEIERRAGRPISQCFDLISGTSTGGLISLGLTVRGSDGGPRWKAADLVKMYREASHTIFPRSVLRTLGSPLFDKYGTSGLEEELNTRLCTARLSDALTGIVVTAWNLTHNRPAYFNSAEAGNVFSDPLMREVARATSAAPSYFAPCWIKEPREPAANAFVDGGTFANNPAKIAYLALRPPHAQTRPLLLLSLGTGNPVAEDPRRRRLWGAIPWVTPMVHLFMAAPSELVDVELAQLADDDFSYHRIEPQPGQASPKLDDTSSQNIQSLQDVATQLIADHDRDLKKICDELKKRQ